MAFVRGMLKDPTRHASTFLYIRYVHILDMYMYKMCTYMRYASNVHSRVKLEASSESGLTMKNICRADINSRHEPFAIPVIMKLCSIFC